MLDYTSGGAWRFAGKLPSPRYGLGGIKLDGVLFMTSGSDAFGYFDDMLFWDPVTESWNIGGHVGRARERHGVLEVNLEAMENICINELLS